MSTNMQEPGREDLGADGNDALIDPLPEENEQPRPDQVDPEEPLDPPADPSKDDPRRVQGEPTEDDE